MNETVVETKTCNHCQSSFDITQGDLDFYDKVSPSFAGQIFAIPTPTLCPDCRQRRRLSFRNERKLYRRICDATQQPIISIYSPDKPYKIYDQKTRRSDSRDAMDYGFEFDFTKTFTQNFDELLRGVPRYNLYNFDNENSEYVQYLPHSKDCYLVFGGRYCNSCLYSGTLMECENCMDSLYLGKSTHCYECVNLENCNTCFYSKDSQDCSNCYYVDACVGCKFCFGCFDIQNQQYMIYNKQGTKIEYEQFIASTIGNIHSYQNRYINILGYEKFRPIIKNSENVIGNYIYNSYNIYHCKQSRDSENIRWSMRFAEQKDSVDIYGSAKGSLLYDSLCCDYGYQVGFSSDSENCKNSYYIDLCYNSSNCFGCVGLRNKQYCIFNHQYTKEEYEIQVAKIIQHMMTTGEWGEFFHPSLSPFGYNETVAQEYYLLSAVGASLASPDNGQGEPSPYAGINFTDHGYTRSMYQAPTPKSDKIIKGSELPDIITTVEDSILQYAISCEATGQLFRIQPQELTFYRKHNIPLPRKHPDQRHLERLALRK